MPTTPRSCLVSILMPALVFTGFVTGRTAQAVPAQGQRIMVAGPSPNSVAIAQNISLKGGNAVDAAVAVALGLAVTHPYYASLGGGGFAIVKLGKKVRALDFRETAPAAAQMEWYREKPDASTTGGLAIGVPGVTAGLWELHHSSGKLKWSELFTDAIQLAEKGFRVSGEWAFLTERNQERFTVGGLKAFFKKDKSAFKPGDLFKQPALAKLLRQIAQKGPSAFYQGANAKDVVDSVNAAGGKFTLKDLAGYKTRWLEPLVADNGGFRFYLMPPPSSGGIVIAQALRLVDKTHLTDKAPLSVDEFHTLAEIEKISYRGRSLLGDPDFAKNPIDGLLSDTYLDPLAALVKPDHVIDVTALDKMPLPPGVTTSPLPAKESENTTHFSIMDGDGNTVALTVTLNGDYGSGVVGGINGVALNNEMDDFTTRPGKPNMFGLIQGEANQVRPGARPLSSMSPTVIEKEGQTVLSLGAPGGPRIISSVFQVAYRLTHQSFDVDQAIQAPRVHHQFSPDIVVIDNLKLPPETIAALEKKGHKFKTGSTGKVYAVRRTDAGILQGAADARGEGAAGGL